MKKNKPKISLDEFKEMKNKSSNDISLQKMKDLAETFSVSRSGTKREIADKIERSWGVICYKK